MGTRATLLDLLALFNVSCASALFVLIVPVAAAAQLLAQPGDNDAPQPQDEDTPRRWSFAWRDHPSWSFGEVVRIDLRARFQGDLLSTSAPSGNRDVSGFDLARRRIGVGGEIGRVIEFEIERELADDNPWRDVYANYKQFRVVRLQAGKFKLPFGLDENTSSTRLDFAYRARISSQLAPGRDRGVMAHGRFGEARYEAGLFAHDGDNARGRDTGGTFAGTTFAARLFGQPLRRSKRFRDLRAGVALTTGDVPEGPADLRGQTALGQTFFPRRFWVNGTRRRLGLEARWRPGPFSLQSEYMRLTSERLGQGVDDRDLPALIGSGWYASGTWIVTGERKSDGALEPARPMLAGGYGSIELAARLEHVRFGSRPGGSIPSSAPRGDTLLAHGDRALTLGVNWSPHRVLRVQVNAIREVIAGPEREPLVAHGAFWSRVLRFQFAV